MHSLRRAVKTKTKTKNKNTTNGSKQGYLADLLLSMWAPLLISAVVMFQPQNRETIKMVIEKLLCPSRSLWRWVWQDHVSQDQDQDRFFLVSDRSCPKTDGLRPHHSHHCYFPEILQVRQSFPIADFGDCSCTIFTGQARSPSCHQTNVVKALRDIRWYFR